LRIAARLGKTFADLFGQTGQVNELGLTLTGG
jgi:hypothetical protein